MFYSVKEVDSFFAYHNPEDFGYSDSDLRKGNGTCLGDGLVEYPVFYTSNEGVEVCVGTVLYDNGTQRNKYDQSDEDVANFECYRIDVAKDNVKAEPIISWCGEIVGYKDDRYSMENPSSAGAYYAELHYKGYEEAREEYSNLVETLSTKYRTLCVNK
jgi:hypothetical protein